jgi:CrcB protein
VTLSLPLVIGIGLIGGAGAIARFLLDGAVSARLGRDFPFGTLAVNLSGAFVLGVLAGVALSEDAARLLGLGLVGAFTTFSTWALESHRLGEDGRLQLGTLNFAVSLIAGVALAWLGRELGASL